MSADAPDLNSLSAILLLQLGVQGTTETGVWVFGVHLRGLGINNCSVTVAIGPRASIARPVACVATKASGEIN